jgi:hypothetical protein
VEYVKYSVIKFVVKNTLKILKEYLSEFSNQRTQNPMPKIENTNNDAQTTSQKTNDRATRMHILFQEYQYYIN